MKLTATWERFLAKRRKGPARRRKTLDIDQRLLDDVRARLKAVSETQAVQQALERVRNNREHADFIRWMAKNYKIDRKLIDV